MVLNKIRETIIKFIRETYCLGRL